MASFEELHVTPAIARALDRRGWTPETPGVKDLAPTAARGQNLVAVTPPVPVYAAPALAGMLSRLEPGKPALVVAPAEQLDEWGLLISDLVREASLRVQVARGAARAMRRLRAEPLDVVVTTLETALLLVARSALRMDAVGTLLLAWPESLPDDDSMMPLMQDLSRDAQRIVFTGDPARVTGAADRYARKALTIGVPPAPVTPVGPVRTVSTSWSGRLRALTDVIELLDPASLVIWTADRGHHDAMLPLISIQPDLQVIVGNAPPSDTIIAFDLPMPDQLRQLTEAGEVVLLVPVGTESYVQHAASPRRPIQLPGPVEAARSTEAAQRATIQKVLETNGGGRALLTLAPLFERYDATAVAAALFELWQGGAPGTAVAPVPAETSGTAKVYVGAGKKDGVTANDLVAVLTKELRFDRTRIGRIELRDAYSLIELPAQDVERLAGQLNGTTIRRKRVTARVDRGSGRPPGGGDRGGRATHRVNPR